MPDQEYVTPTFDMLTRLSPDAVKSPGKLTELETEWKAVKTLVASLA
ncbi:hypothetical protein [Burkholderia ubonensis]|nr:hypothetical protein [Burkholderia ubonensis]